MTAVNHKTRASAFGAPATYAGAVPIEGAGGAPVATVSQVNWIGKSGNWDTAAAWSGGVVPGAPGTRDEVTISPTTAVTVTYSTGSAAIQSLYTGNGDTLEVTGGTLVVGGNGISLNGTLDLTGGTLSIDGNYSSSNSGTGSGIINQSGGVLDLAGQTVKPESCDQTGGTIDVVSGSLYLYDNPVATIDGTVTGNDLDLDLNSGTGTLGSAAAITTTSWELDSGYNDFFGGYNGTWTVLGNLSYAGTFSSQALIVLGSNTLSLLGDSTLSSEFSGSGVVALGGTAQGSFDLGNLETLSNTGKFEQTGYVDLGEAQADSCTISNAVGADWVLASGSAIAEKDSGTGSVSNAGTMEFQSSPFAGSYGGNTITVSTFTSTGSLQIDAGADAVINSTSVSLAGSLQVGEGADLSINSSTVSLGGSLLIDAGAEATINSSSTSLAGTVTGKGTLSLVGTTTFASGLILNASDLILNSSEVKLGSALTYTGSFVSDSGTVLLGGNTLTLAGETTFSSNDPDYTEVLDFSGAGAVVLAGKTALQNFLELESAATVTNTGTLGGDGYIAAPFINEKLLSMGSGDVLYLTGASASLGGTVSGAGTIYLEASSGVTLASGLKLSVAHFLIEDATTLAENLLYAGTFSLEGVLSLAGHSLSLSGIESLGGTISGSGSVKNSGNAVVSGSLDVINNALLTNTHTMTTAATNFGSYASTGTFVIGSGSTDKASLVNASTGVMNLVSSGISSGGAADSFSNAGLVTVSDPVDTSASFSISVSNSGTILVKEGGMSFLSSVSGSGTIATATGASLYFAESTSGGTIALGADSSLTVDQNYAGNPVSFGDVITGFSLGDVITIQGLAYDDSATLSFNSSSGLLTVTDSNLTSETLHLAGTYTASSFNLFDADGYMAISHS